MTSKSQSAENDAKRLAYLQSSLDVLKQDFLRGAIGARTYHNRAYPMMAKIHEAQAQLGFPD